MTQKLNEEIPFERLNWFIRLRWAAIVMGGVILWLGPMIAPVQIQWLKISCCFLLLAVLNVFYIAWVGRLKRSTASLPVIASQVEKFFHVQMIADLIIMTLMLYFNGGADNPLLLFYLFHLTISSIVFPTSKSLGYAILALCLPWLLYFLEPSIHASGGDLWKGTSDSWDMAERSILLAYSITVVGLWYFLSRLARDLRAQQKALKETGEQLLQANEELKQLDVYKNKFLRQVVHQLKNPAIEMDFDLSAVDKAIPKKNEKTTQAIQTAKKRVWSLLELIDDLVWLSRTQVLEMPMKRESLELYQLLLKRVQSMEGEAKKKELLFQLHGDPQVRLKADKDAMGRVVDNLLSNAVKYTPEGRSPILVEFKTQGDWLILAVEDQGIGIPPKQQKSLFEEFFRASNARTAEKFGTGLGLSIVKQILQWHGGRVHLTSEPKKGTRVETWWPLLDPDEPQR